MGVDAGWISQLESIGYQWVDINKKIDPIFRRQKKWSKYSKAQSVCEPADIRILD